MVFVQISGLSIAIRRDDIVGVEVIGEGDHEWALWVYMRGLNEPRKVLVGDQIYLTQIYRALLDNLGGAKNIPPDDIGN